MTVRSLTRSSTAHRRRTSFFGWLLGLDHTRRQRNQLRSLDAHMREDIGVTDADVERELARSLWDAPQHWRK